MDDIPMDEEMLVMATALSRHESENVVEASCEWEKYWSDMLDVSGHATPAIVSSIIEGGTHIVGVSVLQQQLENTTEPRGTVSEEYSKLIEECSEGIEAGRLQPDVESLPWIDAFLSDMDTTRNEPHYCGGAPEIGPCEGAVALDISPAVLAADGAWNVEVVRKNGVWEGDPEGFLSMADVIDELLNAPESPLDTDPGSELDVVDIFGEVAEVQAVPASEKHQNEYLATAPASSDNDPVPAAVHAAAGTCPTGSEGLGPVSVGLGGSQGGVEVSGRGSTLAGNGVGGALGQNRKRRRRAWERHKQTQDQKRGKSSVRNGQAAAEDAPAAGSTARRQEVDVCALPSRLPEAVDAEKRAVAEQVQGDQVHHGSFLSNKERNRENVGEEGGGGRDLRQPDTLSLNSEESSGGTQGRATELFCGMEAITTDEREKSNMRQGSTDSQLSAPVTEGCPAVSAWSPANYDPTNHRAHAQADQKDGSMAGRHVDASGGSGDDETGKTLQRLIRNRASACESRLRKKAYVLEMEGKCAALEAQLNTLRQVASITAMENGVLRDQLMRFQQYYGHYPGGMPSGGVLPGGAASLVGHSVASSCGTSGGKRQSGRGSATPAAKGNAAPGSEKPGEELSGNSSGKPTSPCKSGDKAEPAALESDSLPSESLPRHSCPSQVVRMWAPLLSFLLALSRGLCHLLVSLFLPLLLVLLNLGGGLPVRARSADVALADVAYRGGSVELVLGATSRRTQRHLSGWEASGKDPGGWPNCGAKYSALHCLLAQQPWKVLLNQIRPKVAAWSTGEARQKQAFMGNQLAAARWATRLVDGLHLIRV